LRSNFFNSTGRCEALFIPPNPVPGSWDSKLSHNSHTRFCQPRDTLRGLHPKSVHLSPCPAGEILKVICFLSLLRVLAPPSPSHLFEILFYLRGCCSIPRLVFPGSLKVSDFSASPIISSCEGQGLRQQTLPPRQFFLLAPPANTEGRCPPNVSSPITAATNRKATHLPTSRTDFQFTLEATPFFSLP